MKVALTVSDYAGHYYPMIPLAQALRRAGHQVTVLCGEGHARQVAALGLPAVGCGTDVDTVVQARLGVYLDALAGKVHHPGLPLLHPLTGAELDGLDDFDWPAHAPVHAAAEADRGRTRAQAVAGFARAERPDLVLHDLLSPEGMLAAHVAQAPAVCHLWGPTGTDETSYGLEALSPDLPAPARERLGIAADADLLRYVVDPCPPQAAPRTRAERLAVRYVPYEGSRPDAAPPAPNGRPRICVVWSNSLTRIFGRGSFIVPRILRALSGRGLDVVAALSDEDAALLGQVPDDVRVLRGHRLSRLLPGSAAVVHHGGAGCAMTALAAGVPQLALPFGQEQALVAERIAASGAGLALRGSAADAGAIAGAVDELLTAPSHRQAAAALAAAHGERPTPDELVPVLAELAADRVSLR
ncbi:glycosyltransferase [Kitasatospora sp. NPDC101235]|uniref:glycosyltransferase n=1 Tax=Kitasatospora sp. NPDC101235 TaxID=3364101 RepID=UPI0037F8847D